MNCDPDALAGPTIPWKEGRSDTDSGNACGPDGRLPDASLDQKHLRDIFFRMVRDSRPARQFVHVDMPNTLQVEAY